MKENRKYQIRGLFKGLTVDPISEGKNALQYEESKYNRYGQILELDSVHAPTFTEVMLVKALFAELELHDYKKDVYLQPALIIKKRSRRSPENHYLEAKYLIRRPDIFLPDGVVVEVDSEQHNIRDHKIHRDNRAEDDYGKLGLKLYRTSDYQIRDPEQRRIVVKEILDLLNKARSNNSSKKYDLLKRRLNRYRKAVSKYPNINIGEYSDRFVNRWHDIKLLYARCYCGMRFSFHPMHKKK